MQKNLNDGIAQVVRAGSSSAAALFHFLKWNRNAKRNNACSTKQRT